MGLSFPALVSMISSQLLQGKAKRSSALGDANMVLGY
jgi:hypothetical protein